MPLGPRAAGGQDGTERNLENVMGTGLAHDAPNIHPAPQGALALADALAGFAAHERAFSAADVLVAAGTLPGVDAVVDASLSLGAPAGHHEQVRALPDTWSDDGFALWHTAAATDDDIQSTHARTLRLVARADGLVNVEALDEVVREELRLHLHGLCFPFALLLHRTSRLPLVIVADGWDGSTVHAAVRTSDRRLMDAAGLRSFQTIVGRYEVEEPVLLDADEAALAEACPLLDARALRRAARLLARLPDHPLHRLRQRRR
jgi:hypothetical protein